MRQNKFTDYAPRAGVIAIFLLIIFLSAACGTATPTTARPIATAPLVLATSAPPPPVIIPTLVLSPTTAITGTRATATVAVTTTRAAPNPTRTSTPKPATLSGRIAYDVVTAAGAQFHQVHTANVDGTNAHQILTGATFGTLSLDGARVAFFSVAGSGRNEGAYVADSNGGNPVKVYPVPGVSGAGVCCLALSPDSKFVVLADSPKPLQPGGPLFLVQVSDSTTIPLNVSGSSTAFSADGKQIIFSGCVADTCGIQMLALSGGGARFITRDNGGSPRLSPKGDKIVFQDNVNGRVQVFVVNVDGSNKKQLTNGKGNDAQPVWSREGGTIFWRSDQGGIGWAIFAMNADGTNPRKIISDAFADPIFWGWESLSVGK